MNTSYIDYSKLDKEDIKLNDKLIISYHKKYKLRYLCISVLLMVLGLYLVLYLRIGDRFTIEKVKESLSLFTGLSVILFFMFDMIKWGLERFKIFKPREIKICKYANEYLNKKYSSNEITEEQFNRMINLYTLDEKYNK